VPTLPLIADDVTVERLLAHRSGIGDYIDEEIQALDASDYLLVTPVHDLATTEAFLSEVDGYRAKSLPGSGSPIATGARSCRRNESRR
jgi:CubicO group peptidase (beta-lactamase class C family)